MPTMARTNPTRKRAPQTSPFQHERADEAREQRRGRDDDAHVGGGRERERGVLQHEREGHAADACGGEQGLLAPTRSAQELRTDEPQRKVADGETQDEDLRRREPDQQDLGRDERDAPQQHRPHREHMAARCAGLHAAPSASVESSRMPVSRIIAASSPPHHPEHVLRKAGRRLHDHHTTRSRWPAEDSADPEAVGLGVLTPLLRSRRNDLRENRRSV